MFRRSSSCASFAPGDLVRRRLLSPWLKMEAQLEHPAEEIKRLQRCVNDLACIQALPAIWSGADPSQIVRTLLDSLLVMLELDFVYVRLRELVGDGPIEMVRIARSTVLPTQPQAIGELLRARLGNEVRDWPAL